MVSESDCLLGKLSSIFEVRAHLQNLSCVHVTPWPKIMSPDSGPHLITCMMDLHCFRLCVAAAQLTELLTASGSNF